MNRPLVIGAQKLFLGYRESIAFAEALAAAVRRDPPAIDVMLCPSLLSLAQVAERLRGSPVAAAAQTFHQEDGGAFTGQVSLRDILDLGVRFTMVGHSELRTQQAETETTVAHKIRLCLKHGVSPVVCLGETREERDAGLAHDVLAGMVATLFRAATEALSEIEQIIVAYEPRWPLATGTDADVRASARAVDATCSAIRGMFADMFGAATAARVRVLYGGGVNEASAGPLLDEFHGDGVLVGRASTRVPAFLEIVRLVTESAAAAAKPTSRY